MQQDLNSFCVKEILQVSHPPISGGSIILSISAACRQNESRNQTPVDALQRFSSTYGWYSTVRPQSIFLQTHKTQNSFQWTIALCATFY